MGYVRYDADRVIDHGVTEETEDQKAFMQNLVPYRYWYTVNCESDIHVDRRCII